MRAGILLFRPSVLFFALVLVVFVTMVALNAGESSAQECTTETAPCAGQITEPGCDPATRSCTTGAGRITEDSLSGGGTVSHPDGTFDRWGGRAVVDPNGEVVCRGNLDAFSNC